MKDMYKNTELISMVCRCCGKEFKRYESNSTKRQATYCSLECEYKSVNQKKLSYELSNVILEFSLNNIYKSTRDIAKIFGVSKDMVTNLIKKYGNRDPKKLIEVDRDYFGTINTEEKAYWLGFLYADGSVTRRNSGGVVDLTLGIEDESHIVKFKNSLGYKGKIKYRSVKLKNKTHKAVRLTICSDELSSDLIKLGCIENKSLLIEFPKESQVPINLVRHFIRGYVDGDGCLGIYNGKISFSVIGTKSFLESIKNHLLNELGELGIMNVHSDKRWNNDVTSYISKGGNYAKAILKYLYEDSSIYLDRKYKKYLEIINNN